MMIADADLVDKPAIREDCTAWALDLFRLNGVRISGCSLSLKRCRQRFGHHVLAVSLNGTRDLWIRDKIDFDSVIDLIAGLLARVLNPTHEVPSQTFLDKRWRQRSI